MYGHKDPFYLFCINRVDDLLLWSIIWDGFCRYIGAIVGYLIF